MQKIHLLHNPGAGDETHNKDHLVAAIEKAGFTCNYTSTKLPGWKPWDQEADLIAIGGGDGTVRKVIKKLLKDEKNAQTILLAVLPLGTANNIAKTFKLANDPDAVIQSWEKGQIKRVDIGSVRNVPDVEFFLEGFGFGIFPLLMKEMKKKEGTYHTPEEELQGALKTLHQIFLNYKPRRCELEVDGTDHSGMFYMVEVMNIQSIGPNMVLAPLADPGDGELEVVLVPEAHKEKFSDFLMHRLTQSEEVFHFHTLKGKKIRIRWDGTRLHADDKMLKLEKETEVCIEIKEGALQFLVPADESANG